MAFFVTGHFETSNLFVIFNHTVNFGIATIEIQTKINYTDKKHFSRLFFFQQTSEPGGLV